MDESGFAAALLPRVGEIAAATVARLTAEIPAYRLLPDSVIDGDLLANTEAVLRLFLTSLAEGRLPAAPELAAPVAWGAERARDGVPLEAVLRVYSLGAGEAWKLALAATQSSDSAESGIDPYLLGTRLLGFLGEVMPKVAEAYVREQADLDWEQREHGRNLADVLLAGRPARRAAERYGRTLAERYEVVVFRLPDAQGGAQGGAATGILRAVRTELDRNPEVLATLKGEGGVLLVPVSEEAGGDPAQRGKRPPQPQPQPCPARRLLARLDAATELRCIAAAATAPGHAAVAQAHTEACEVLALAESLGRAPGLYRLADLAVEYQLVQPGPARDALVATLAPLADQPHLLDTLREFIASGYRRAEAAQALTVHRNTLTYRLARIHLLTGHDATDPADARRLTAALTAHDAARGAAPGTAPAPGA
ncbi:helix-turn-helix domain-containing protein (plasmid) [Streptomyces sp. NBC_00536]|uniref:PucR family transcriptional regulator n=1 Tax=Streptomyces sp. NBC_00536 TaxID=2975769 RepID=UPI002E81194B|nr:helix-turn-helix domain-containing protein [Streptomyces sp. NBC_00536]WUC84138.1 helix-turn-helix domain-containing protein [Streptomyces sp. NBC_00536]